MLAVAVRCALVLMAVGPLLAADLDSRMRQALAAVPGTGECGVAVIDCATGTWLYRRDADRPLRLASVTKLLTSAAALEVLGPNHRFVTRLVALGPNRAGALAGLGVVGSGDPCLDGHFYEQDPDAPFRQWAQALKARGVVRIEGDLVIDARLFAGPCRPPTYPADQRNQQSWFSAPASAFAWNDNCLEVRVLPGQPGMAAVPQVRPRSPRIAMVNRTRTGGSGGDLLVNRAADGNALTVSGTYGAATNWYPLAIASDPDLLAGDHLKAVLAEQGLAVTGEVRLGAAQGDALVETAHDLLPALALMNQRSQNFYAEQMLRLVGARKSGQGSVEAGSRAAAAALAGLLGAEAAAIQQLDGSGLSYENRASAAAVARLLQVMQARPYGAAFVAGLKDKDGGKARGKVKTGTLAVAACLAGYVDGPDGRRLAFCVLCGPGTGKWGWGGQVRDAVFRAVAAAACE